MKTLAKLGLLAMAISLNSCSKNDSTEETCTGENYTIHMDRYLSKLTTIHPGYLPVTKNYEYSYNAYNLLDKKEEYTFDYDENRIFNYECGNNLKTVTTNDSNLNYMYQYDDNNRLIAYKTTDSYLHDYSIEYDGNSLIVTGIINSKSTSIILETNDDGLVTKITRENGYSNFIYDDNGNIIEVKDYDGNSNVSLKEFEIIYDNNPNPFYGQLQSGYIVQFINFFSQPAIFGVDIFFRFDQYKFPYLKNNPVLLKFKSCTDCYQDLITRTYEYDAQNYPVKMEESYVGTPAVVYEYQYK